MTTDNRNSKRHPRRLLALLLCWTTILLMLGCSDDTVQTGGREQQTVTHKVAVIIGKNDIPRWSQTADWALQNLAEAQQGMDSKVSLQLEYKSEGDADIEDYMHAVANDTTYQAIIGPCDAKLAEKMAGYLGDAIEQHYGNDSYRKPMISPTATDVEYQRKFSGKDYLWNMAESDITQLEIIMSQFASGLFSHTVGITVVASSEDASGPESDRLLYWLGFIAEEYGITIQHLLLYDNTEQLRSHVRQLPDLYTIADLSKILFIPADEEDVLAFDEEFGLLTNQSEAQNQEFVYRIFCTDHFVSQQVHDRLSHNSRLQYEGYNLYASPESGFAQAYQHHFHSDLLYGEAQFYDAVCLLAYAGVVSQHAGATLCQGVTQVVSGTDGLNEWACYPSGMRQTITLLQSGSRPMIHGATGQWLFDAKHHTQRQNSVYRHWVFSDGTFLTKGYVTLKGTGHSSSSQDVWNWTANQYQSFADQDVAISYPQLNDRWAFLIAASSGWPNYRFQADVLAMYHILLNHGYDRNHIVVVEEDDLAYSTSNKVDQGAVRVSDSGENLYDPSFIDYKLSNLTTDDVGDILLGRKSDRLPKVIHSTPNDNVLIFWSGHGVPNQLDFGNDRIMTYTKMRNYLNQMSHRKMLLVTEACYSGGLGSYCEGIPGLLVLTACSHVEECHASRWSQRLGVYLTNAFSEEFQEVITEQPHILIKDLYYRLVPTVSGSHVKIYNNNYYGNIHKESMSEFLK